MKLFAVKSPVTLKNDSTVKATVDQIFILNNDKDELEIVYVLNIGDGAAAEYLHNQLEEVNNSYYWELKI